MQNEIYHMDTEKRELKWKCIEQYNRQIIKRNLNGFVNNFRKTEKLKTEIDE